MARKHLPYSAARAKELIKDNLLGMAIDYLRLYGKSVPMSCSYLLIKWKRRARVMENLGQDWTEEIRAEYHQEMAGLKQDLTQIAEGVSAPDCPL